MEAPRKIRLLRLLPDTNENAPIQVQLFEYPLPEYNDGLGSHFYEALSYVWGDTNSPRTVSVVDSGHSLGLISVTTNLYAALLRLRDRWLDRVLWIDAVCINQEDEREKEWQIRRMAQIYSRASRVVVWLGETGEHGDEEALADIRQAAAASGTDLDAEVVDYGPARREAIIAMLQRPWFKRMWVSSPSQT